MKVAVKKAAEESARKTWEVERQELIRQIRTLHGSLDKQGKENQRLVSEKNALEVCECLSPTFGRTEGCLTGSAERTHSTLASWGSFCFR